ncbi:MAG: hypothetical protein F4Z01_10275 [Gammaproteobacteria bacterium]|nr:hypothetical protein [Gammaproteobacteria bacterium]
MVNADKQSSKQKNSLHVWVVGIPVSLMVLGLFVLFIQPWGEPRESITSTAPKDGDFYDPSSDEATVDSLGTESVEESSTHEESQPRSDSSRIVDVNLASWKPIDESSIPEDQLPSQSEEVLGQILVEISTDLWSKTVGDGVQFSIPQQEVVLIGKVTEVDTSFAQTRIMEGTVEDGPQDYSFVLNLGDATTYAHINTSSGSVKLVGTRRYGWLMESVNIGPDFDFSLPEHFIVIPQDRELEPEPQTPNDE